MKSIFLAALTVNFEQLLMAPVVNRSVITDLRKKLHEWLMKSLTA